jgi:hypothetical protein
MSAFPGVLPRIQPSLPSVHHEGDAIAIDSLRGVPINDRPPVLIREAGLVLFRAVREGEAIGASFGHLRVIHKYG